MSAGFQHTLYFEEFVPFVKSHESGRNALKPGESDRPEPFRNSRDG